MLVDHYEVVLCPIHLSPELRSEIGLDKGRQESPYFWVQCKELTKSHNAHFLEDRGYNSCLVV